VANEDGASELMASATRDAAGREHTADRLLASSQAFAQSALGAYVDEQWEVFHLHLATAVEHLLKSVLARANPLFIADGRRFDSLLHFAGMSQGAATPPSAARTITVGEALERVKLLVDDYPEPTAEVRTLLYSRNAMFIRLRAPRVVRVAVHCSALQAGTRKRSRTADGLAYAQLTE
jgi:hypothetical protein